MPSRDGDEDCRGERDDVELVLVDVMPKVGRASLPFSSSIIDSILAFRRTCSGQLTCKHIQRDVSVFSDSYL